MEAGSWQHEPGGQSSRRLFSPPGCASSGCQSLGLPALNGVQAKGGGGSLTRQSCSKCFHLRALMACLKLGPSSKPREKPERSPPPPNVNTSNIPRWLVQRGSTHRAWRNQTEPVTPISPAGATHFISRWWEFWRPLLPSSGQNGFSTALTRFTAASLCGSTKE